ncbi:alpha-amylase family glycosyl hydrolase [Neobacillus sp. LXY-1]|uniref:alpha-amylase family glycosyl hydrolase n=1 Tax=Neobacillus sp. LXY-1 TaxID=3379133 RepID=UPI003EE37418
MKKIIVLLIFALLFTSAPVSAKVEKEQRLWQDETVYSIMVDRFNDGDITNDHGVNSKDPVNYNGGDLQGVIDKLDYIKDMGFTAIKLSPVFDNADNGYHGYWVKDFYKVDEHFGSLNTMEKLVKEAHKRKMKVIIDFVANNVAKSHPWTRASGKQDWFHKEKAIVDWNNQKEVEDGWVDGLPDLNQGNPEVKQYLIDAAKWWIHKTDIDGYSLPEINAVPLSFWSDFSKAVKQEKKGFYLVGMSTPETSTVNTGTYENAGITSMFDYHQINQTRLVFATTDQSVGLALSEDKNAEINVNFFDNEYTTRFTRDIVEQRQFPGARWKTALTYAYTTPGIPFVYYGTEIALTGGPIPDNRRQMNFRAEKDLIEYMTKIGELRDQLPSLTRGSMEMLYDQKGMMVYKRVYKGETSIIAINNTKKSQKVTLTSEQVEGNKELRGLLAGDLVRSYKGKYNIIIDRDNSEIYVLAEKTGLNVTFISAIAIAALLVLIFLLLIIRRSKRGQIN